jgi:hypothetical protein
MYNHGTIYISKKVNVYDFLDADNEDLLLELVDQDKAQRYDVSEFKDEYKAKLEEDLKLLREIKTLWQDITIDPKLDQFVEELKKTPELKDGKIVIPKLNPRLRRGE